jgi:tetratricopeptide (TPR) repeat protein
MTEQIEPIDAADTPSDALAQLRATLDRLLAGHAFVRPESIPEADRERLALSAGYLPGLRPVPGVADVRLDEAESQQPLTATHQRAARLAGQRRLPAAIHVLQRMAREQPTAAALHYQIGTLSAALGRTHDAIASLEAAAALRPDAAEVPEALAAVLTADGRTREALDQAELGVTLSGALGPREVSKAHQLAARTALAHGDSALALTHADAAQAASPVVPMRAYVEGRLLVDEGRYEEAVRLLQEAAAMLQQHDTALEGVYTTLASALVAVHRPGDAEAACLEELRTFPRSLAAYVALAGIARAAHDDEKVESTVESMLTAVPTPAGYAAAIRVWIDAGAPARAEALRSDARARFQGDPSLAQLPARGGRR